MVREIIYPNKGTYAIHMTSAITQTPRPSQRLLQFRGDRLTFMLTASPQIKGQAFVRTNLGHARITRREIIRQVEFNEPRLARDWFDIPMRQTAPGRFEAEIGLDEVGHFEAKCLLIPEGHSEPLWPSGPNTAINVEPADTCCGNIIYNAFVRQFGGNKHLSRSDYSASAEAMQALDRAGFTVIPPSGKFRDLIAELDFIMGRLGCRILQLLPIHPTPTTYARMGRYGSPYAALGFTSVDPALAVFDPKATPLEQFLELVDAVHARQGKIIIDIAINHTGWAADLHETHPQWLARNHKGEIENPGAWGVVWADLTRLDYEHQDMWPYMADVFLTWCRRGVDGFRCDAGYMIQSVAWQYIIAKVRDQFPDTLFFLEGLGGKISVTRDLLNSANFNWAYSELFQNYDRNQIEHYLPDALEIAAADGVVVHFAETHDNNRLASVSKTYARMRTALCALLAPQGAFAFANGVEWFATEKVNVHEACTLNWGAAENQVDAIAGLSALLKTHPAFDHPVDLTLVADGEGNYIAFKRLHRANGRWVLVLVNLDCEKPVTAGWSRRQAEFAGDQAIDLLTRLRVPVKATRTIQRVPLLPGQVLCLSDAADPWLQHACPDAAVIPPAAVRQQLRAKALEVLRFADQGRTIDLETAVEQLQADPLSFCRSLNQQSDAARVIFWQYPADARRRVMVPPGHFVLLRADHPFRARLVQDDHILAVERSLQDQGKGSFVLLTPRETPGHHLLNQVEITLFAPGGTRHDKGELLYLAAAGTARVRKSFSRNDCHQIPLLVLGTNGRGAMMRVNADWLHIGSRYNALLAANLSNEYPEDRQVMLSRCRAWVVYQGFSQSVKLDCLDRFGFDYTDGAWWRYQVPTGQGEHIVLQISLRMLTDQANTIELCARRLVQVADREELSDDKDITLVIRPDIEDRNFHYCTKAYTGPENKWPAAVAATAKGFTFAPSPGYRLVMQTDRGRFSKEPEWYYMVHRPLEAERGLDPDSDLFSTGYFSVKLKGGQQVNLKAAVLTSGQPDMVKPAQSKHPQPVARDDQDLASAMAAALEQFIVKRGGFRTVIAGYPWFLDWGRDTLIVVRGLIAAGRLEAAKGILIQFACFEEHGTIPNMIRGDDARNRDTSDAPLWFFLACRDLVTAEGHPGFIDSDCNGRCLGRVLSDMADRLTRGTPNGIRMDQQTGLIFSPSHFTWMDTNYPAGTPRQGYPVEIQALWYAALAFLCQVDTAQAKRWHDLAQQVRESIIRLFWRPELGYLADCRHASPGQGAVQAVADDALRPNQLLAITLGAIEDKQICRHILDACQTLLVPGAIRSLADRPVQHPLEVSHNGKLLNNPQAPYWGTYAGDEDTRRKPAYHNGTAWTWLFPSYCEAWAMCYGPAEHATALAWLSSSVELLNSHCLGQIPEILDGDAPHRQRGCDAQAWGVSELLRVWKKLS